jgi:DNA invertase Pin-like site-specific DNA recombinase
MIWDRGELVEAVGRWLRARFPVGEVDVLAEGLVEVVEAELRRQHGDRIRAGLEAARGRGGGRGGRLPALGRVDREELVRDAAVMTYAELGERYGLSVSTVGRYLRGEV